MEELEVESRGDVVVFRVRVTPRASRERIGGVHGGALKVAVTAPPVDGDANAALTRALAKALGVARSDIAIVRGKSGRDKTLEVGRVSEDAVRALARG